VCVSIDEVTVELSLKHVIRRFSYECKRSPESMIKLLPSLDFSIQVQIAFLNLTFMEPCIARCVFYITNVLRVSGGRSAHYQEPIRLYVQQGIVMLSCCLPLVDSRKA